MYHPMSIPTMDTAGSARDLCDLLWVIDRDEAEAIVPGVTGTMVRLLQRLGGVVDVTGLAPQDAADAIAARSPDGILALSDDQMVRTADLAHRLGLPAMSAETALALADKEAQRAALRSAGMDVPGSWRIPDAGDDAGWAVLAAEATFPAVVKPREGAGSRNTIKVQDLDELTRVLGEVARSTPADRGGLQLEAYLRDRDEPYDARFADYLSVESVVSDGRITHFGITGRMPVAPPFRETGFFLPAAPPAEIRDAVLAVATDAARAVGVRAGTLHTEIKLTPEGPRVIEVNGRPGGSVPRMTGNVGGWDVIGVAMRLALGEDVSIEPLPPASEGRVGLQFLLQPPPAARRVAALEGLDAIRALTGVDEIFVNRGAGAAVDWRLGTNEFILKIDGVVDGVDAVAALYAQAEALLDVRYE
jgi:biotin carboxylase